MTPMRLAPIAGAALVALWLLCAAGFGLFGCATAPTARNIASDLDRSLQFLAGWPLSVRCQAVRDAMTRCERAGFASGCAFDGWSDADRDAWTIAACLQHRETP